MTVSKMGSQTNRPAGPVEEPEEVEEACGLFPLEELLLYKNKKQLEKIIYEGTAKLTLDEVVGELAPVDESPVG
jgi:hypothetical protein